jgi:hypothetical protein
MFGSEAESERFTRCLQVGFSFQTVSFRLPTQYSF